MALTASPAEQRLLLDVQAHDTALQQLAHRERSLPERETLSSAISVFESRPTILAGSAVPSSSMTVTLVAPLTTWLLGTT